MENDDIIQREVAGADLLRVLSEYLDKGYDAKRISELRRRKKGRFVVVFERHRTIDDESEGKEVPMYQLC